MQRIFTIVLLLLSLTFLGQARVEPFSCGAAVAYSSVNDAGCQKGCCKNSSCCKTQRTDKGHAYSLQRSTAGRYALVWMYFLAKPAGPGSAHADGVSGTERCGGIRPARSGY